MTLSELARAAELPRATARRILFTLERSGFVAGDGKRFLVAGVWLDEAAVAAHLAALPQDARAEATRALVQARIDRVNADLASYETIKRFTIVGEPLSVDGGHLTPTLKLRRKQIYAAFRDVFESLYNEGSASTRAELSPAVSSARR